MLTNIITRINLGFGHLRYRTPGGDEGTSPDQCVPEPRRQPEGFVPFNGSGESLSGLDSVYDSDDILDKRETDRQRYLVDQGLTTQNHITEGNTLRNSMAHEFRGMPRYERNHIVAGLTDVLGQKEMEDFHNSWVPNIQRQRSQKAQLLEEIEPQSKSPSSNSSGGSDYLADRENSPATDISSHSILAELPKLPNMVPLEVQVAKGLPKYADALNTSIRFCVFNIRNTSKPEFWEIIRSRLTPEVLAGIVRLENVTQPNGHKRMDMWVKTKVASKLKSALYLTSSARREGVVVDYKYPLRDLKDIWTPNKRTRSWRIDVFRTWRERDLVPKVPKALRMDLPRKALATFNVNGLWSKKSELCLFLQRQNIGVIALQETLLDQNNYSLHLPGYNTYERPKSKSFRGQALAVHSSLTSYEVDGDRDESFIHVKVVGLTEGAPWHIISVYLPSGGNFRSARTSCLNKVLAVQKRIAQKTPNARVVIMGDFNMKRDRLRRLIKTEKSGLEVAKISGNGLTFHRKAAGQENLDCIHRLQESL
jgi:hypothetical protein